MATDPARKPVSRVNWIGLVLLTLAIAVGLWLGICLPLREYQRAKALEQGGALVSGTVTSWEDLTDAVEDADGRRSGLGIEYKVGYVFEVAVGSVIDGESYVDTDPKVRRGDRIKVRYLPSNPTVNALEEYRVSEAAARVDLQIKSGFIAGFLVLGLFAIRTQVSAWGGWRPTLDVEGPVVRQFLGSRPQFLMTLLLTAMLLTSMFVERADYVDALKRGVSMGALALVFILLVFRSWRYSIASGGLVVLFNPLFDIYPKHLHPVACIVAACVLFGIGQIDLHQSVIEGETDERSD